MAVRMSWIAAGTILATWLAFGGDLRAAEVRVISSPALSAAMTELGPRFEQATGHTLTIKYGLIAPMRQHIEKGEPFDLAIIPAALMDAIGTPDRFDAGTISEIARISLGLAVRAGGPKPAIGTVDDFRTAMLNTRAVAYIGDEPTGIHVAKMLDQLAIGAQMAPKTRTQKGLQQVLQATATGEVEFGFALISNIVSERVLDLVGPLPPALQYQVILKAGVGKNAAQAPAARALGAFLMTPEAATVLRAKGLDPAQTTPKQ